MTVLAKTDENMSAATDNSNKSLKVKLKAGSSIIKVKPVFTHDSRFVIVASHCDLKVFAVASGDCIQTLRCHKSPVVSIQENKKNQLQIFSCSEDGTVIRWDYMASTAVKVYRLKLSTRVSAFYAPAGDKWFASTKYENADFHRLYATDVICNRTPKNTVVMEQVYPDSRTVAFGVSVKFVAGIFGNTLTVFDCKTRLRKCHKIGTREFTCVACHPSEYLVATGDSTGRILLWTDMLTSNSPTRSTYHWHSLPVADLIFTLEGSHIYSGGGEAVLVKWNLNYEEKHFLPRLGLPISYVAVSPDSSLVATAHADNAVQIISAQRRVVQVFQGLSVGHFQGVKNNTVAPVGLQYDPRTLSIVTNGRIGHLQFYKISEDKQLFNLDIIGRNIMCQERDRVVVNPDVDKAALDHEGMWLATVESRNDKETSPEIHLKFWNFELTRQKFNLNTSVYLPHYKEVNCIKFRPPSQHPNESYPPMVVTTSSDSHFKLWVLNSAEKNDKLVFNWSCESMGYYQGLLAQDASFSEDGSLLAVAFGRVATLWTPDTTMLKTTLFQTNSREDIQQLIFGQKKCSHLLVCHSGSLLTVWNVLSLTVLWSVKCNIRCIAGDPNSDVMVAFTVDKNMFVFRPSSPKPLVCLTNVSETDVMYAIFVPRQHPLPADSITSQNSWLQYSEIYFLNKNQELKTVCEEEDEEQVNDSNLNILKTQIYQRVPATPFALLQAEQQRSDIKPVIEDAEEMNESNEQRIRENYGYQNPAMLCQLLIPSLLYQKKRIGMEQHNENTDVVPIESEIDSEEESPAQYKVKTVSRKPASDLPSRSIAMETEECYSKERVADDFGFIQELLST